MQRNKSAEKRNRTSRVRAMRNASVKSSVKTAVRKVVATLGTAGTLSAEPQLREAFSAIDKAAKKGVIHRNQAARRKSRLAKRFNAQAEL